MSIKTLKPIIISAPHESLESFITKHIKAQVYAPMLKALKLSPRILNATGLAQALLEGIISYTGEKFVGKFTAEISSELKALGAVWSDKGWRLPPEQLPAEVTIAIKRGARAAYDQAMAVLKALDAISPEQVANLSFGKFFDASLYHTEKEFQTNVQKLAVAPNLTPHSIEAQRTEYHENIKRSIKDLTAEQTAKMREQISKITLSGGRAKEVEGTVRDYMKAVLQENYSVAATRIQFIAKQETKLSMSAYTYARYQAAGIKRYKWKCVTGTALHPVRPYHKALDNTIQEFDKPPVTDAKGSRNNPQEDFRCRCTALPIIEK